jgi:hypothetical protein
VHNSPRFVGVESMLPCTCGAANLRPPPATFTRVHLRAQNRNHATIAKSTCPSTTANPRSAAIPLLVSQVKRHRRQGDSDGSVREERSFHESECQDQQRGLQERYIGRLCILLDSGNLLYRQNVVSSVVGLGYRTLELSPIHM